MRGASGQFLPVHGEEGTRLYRIWDAMKRRSTRKHAKSCYAGVPVCTEWSSYTVFAQWARQNGYSDALTIDRIDGSKGYEPDNCRWVTYTLNNRNRRNVRFTIEIARAIRARYRSGVLQKDLAEEHGVTQGQISAICSGARWREA